MLSFDQIYAAAAIRKGDKLEDQLPEPVAQDALRGIADHRFLAAMTRGIFQSGFVWRVVENKWPSFEEVFQGFDPDLLSVLPEDAYAVMARDARIIRNRQKVDTVPRNAQMVMDTIAEHGSFGNYLADWPSDNIVGLWQDLSKRGARLGGNTGPFFLRRMGKDTFMLTGDVTIALQRMGLIGKNPHTKSAHAAAQKAFNAWQLESGRPLCQISRLLSYTVSRDAPTSIE